MSFDDDDYDSVEGEAARPYTLVVSANDAVSLRANIDALCRHLINPRVRVSLPDLAYTLSQRRTQFWHRAFVTARTTEFQASDFVVGKKSPKEPRLGFIFTGQGAQWSQMGKDLLQFLPETRTILEEFDAVLQGLPSPPSWSFLAELTEPRPADQLRQPEFSQPLVTALQLIILAILESWGVKPGSVVGHSSGEIAAAYAAGYLGRADAIKAAFYRGKAAVNRRDQTENGVGMLAVGLGAEAAGPFMTQYTGDVWIACFNSPSSLTVSGRKKALESLADDIKSAGYFARLLQVDLAYHSQLLGVIGDEYEALLSADTEFSSTESSAPDVTMFSSVTASKMTAPTDALYWKTNMMSPVRFSEALTAMVTDAQKPDILIEIGPSGALAGPVSQVLKSLSAGDGISYYPSWSRGPEAVKSLFAVAGRLYIAGAPVDLARVNHADEKARFIVDLPNYSWNHSIKYWFENEASRDWRFKPFKTHDLIGSKVLSSPWQAPSWRKRLDLADVPWLRDHAMGSDVLMPAAGYVAMALEALYQKHCSTNPEQAVASPGDLAYRFRNVRFERALVLEDGKPVPVVLSLSPVPGSTDWHEFRVSTEVDGAVRQHCHGLVRVQDAVDEHLTGAQLAPLRNPTSSKLWYKAQNEVGMGFGPAFQKILSIEAASGQRACRTRLSLEPPKSKWDPQSYYPIHPAVLDACLQSINPALVAGERSKVQDIMIPSVLDDILVNKVPAVLHEGLSVAESIFTERGRKDQLKSYVSNVSMHDPETGALFVRVRGIHITKLDMGPRPDPHTFHRVSWKPDISSLTQDQLFYLSSAAEAKNTGLETIIDLVAHKKPTLKILEVSLDGEDASSLWFGGDDSSARTDYSRWDFASTDAKALVGIQTQYESRRGTSFFLARPETEALGLSTGVTYDLAIVQVPKKTDVAVEEFVRNVKSLLTPSAFILLVVLGDKRLAAEEALAVEALSEDESQPSSTGLASPNTPDDESSSGLGNSTSTTPSSVSSVRDVKASSKPSSLGHVWKPQTLRLLGKVEGLFSPFLEVDTRADGDILAFLGTNTGPQEEESGHATDERPSNLVVLRLDNTTPKLAPSLQTLLESSGWTVFQRTGQLSPSDHNSKTVVLVLDELSKPLLTHINGQQWDALKTLVSSGTPVLWVTKGAQHDRVTDPDRALVHGLFRVIRREDPTAHLTILDVQSGTSPAAASAINQVLRHIRRRDDGAETEYAERDGILYTQRVVPDIAVNAFKRAEVEGNTPVVKGFHETDVQVHIHGERVGTLDLAWCEEELVEPELDAGSVEVEVKTIGVNFKVSVSCLSLAPTTCSY